MIVIVIRDVFCCAKAVILRFFLAILILGLGPDDFVIEVHFLDVVYANANQFVVYLVARILTPDVLFVKEFAPEHYRVL